MARDKKIYSFAEGLTTVDTYAVLGDALKFKKHKHAWKVWRILKQFGCVVYPVAEELKRLDGSKIFHNLAELEGKVTVVIPCLPSESLKTLVSEAVATGVSKIWFQELTWTQELQQECDSAGITVVRGCVLRHTAYPIVGLHYLNPCYWHGLKAAKVPSRRLGR